MTAEEQALARFRSDIDPDTQRYSGDAGDLPAHWRGYLDPDPAARLATLQAEADQLADYLPETAAQLIRSGEEALILNSRSHGPCRVVMRRVRGALYPAWSRVPLGTTSPRNPAARALLAGGPPVLRWIYRNLMDGLTDSWGFGGPRNTTLLTTMADEVDTYGEVDWYEAFSFDHRPDRLIEIFASGGAGYLLVDLDDPSIGGSDPDAFQVLLKEDEAPRRVPLFAYLDAWSAIALGA